MATRRSAVAPECAPAGHSGAGHGHPHGSVPHVTSDESGGPAERRGAARSVRRRTGAGGGNLEIWNPGNLHGCGARQVFRFSGFQVFTRSARGWQLPRLVRPIVCADLELYSAFGITSSGTP